MSVWISDEKLLIFASLISPSKFVKNTPLRVVFFNSLLGVSSGDETLHLMFDILHKQQQLTMHLKDAEMLAIVDDENMKLGDNIPE